MCYGRVAKSPGAICLRQKRKPPCWRTVLAHRKYCAGFSVWKNCGTTSAATFRKRSPSRSRFWMSSVPEALRFSRRRKFSRTFRDKNRNTLVKGDLIGIYSSVNAHKQTKASLKRGLGAAIRRERSVLRISQGELASRAGLHRTYVSDLERGARNPSIDSIEKLARALEISVAKLFAAAGNGKH